ESVAITPDCKTLVVGGDTGVQLREVASGKLLRRLELGHVVSVVFAPDGRSFAASGSGGGVVWETATGKVVTRFEGTTGTIAYSPDARLLAQSRGKKAVLRDMRPGKAAERFLGHDAALRAVAFSPDGKVLAAADEDGAISLWDVAVERRLRKLLGHAV